MDRTSKQGILIVSVMFGSLWGIGEASLGHLLHMASRAIMVPGLAGFVMFPVAFFCMRAAFRMSGSIYSIALTAGITAVIKMASLVLPSVTLIFVVNPTLSILAEGTAVLIFFYLNRYAAQRYVVPKAVAISIAWRLLFLLMILVLPFPKGILNKGRNALLQFVVIDSLVNGLLIGAFLKVRFRWEKVRLFLAKLPSPIVTSVLFIGAVTATIFL